MKNAVQGRDSSATIFHTSGGVPMVGSRLQNLWQGQVRGNGGGDV